MKTRHRILKKLVEWDNGAREKLEGRRIRKREAGERGKKKEKEKREGIRRTYGETDNQTNA